LCINRIRAAKKSGATELDLSFLGLTALPPEIGPIQPAGFLGVPRQKSIFNA